MREKELNKLAGIIVDKLNLIKSNYEVEPIKPMKMDGGAIYDEEVSNKFKKLIKNIIKYNNNININISELNINISTNDIKDIKKYSNNLIHSEDNYLELSINKSGFSLNHGYRKSSRYNDDKIFDELKPIIENRLKEINSENFNSIFDEVMKVSGMLRDNNLEELLEDE